MVRFSRIPEYVQPFTQADVELMIADEDRWFTRGSWLYHASEDQFSQMRDMSDSTVLIVGKPIASDVSDASMRAHEREIMGGMLYGMACECWLKGLVVMATPRKSQARRRRLDAWVSKHTKGIETLRERLLRVLDVFDTPAYQKKRALYESQKATENTARFKRLRTVGGHNLVLLAKEAKLLGHLAKQDLEFLKLLTKANSLGRYPAPWTPNDLAPWAGILSDSRRRERINQAIHRRHSALERMRD